MKRNNKRYLNPIFWVVIVILIYSLKAIEMFLSLTWWAFFYTLSYTIRGIKYSWKKDWGKKFYLGLLICALIGFGFRMYKLEVEKAEAAEYAQYMEEYAFNAELEKEQYASQIQALEKIRGSKKITEKELKDVIAVLFPPEARDRMAKVQNCENGARTADRRGYNKDKAKSMDFGIWQINDYWHGSRIERVFNEVFEKAMGDPAKNTVYAAYLYNTSGANPWVCDRLVNK